MKALDISNTQYNLLYTVYAWTNCLMVLFAGALIDNTTNRMCAIIFCGLACLGQTVLAIGMQVEIFWVMLLGRSMFYLQCSRFIHIYSQPCLVLDWAALLWLRIQFLSNFARVAFLVMFLVPTFALLTWLLLLLLLLQSGYLYIRFHC